MSDDPRFRPAKITERIYQNGYVSEVEAAHLQELGVTHLLNLDLPYGSTKVDLSDRSLGVTEILLHDMAPMSAQDARRVVAAIQRVVELEEGVIYVHCNAGISRSPTAVWLYLVASGQPPAAASELINGAATHLDAPDSILVSELDLEDLAAASREPRWELWRTGQGTHPSLLQVFPAAEEAEAEKTRLQEKLRAFEEMRGRRLVGVRYWLETAWVS